MQLHAIALRKDMAEISPEVLLGALTAASPSQTDPCLGVGTLLVRGELESCFLKGVRL